MFFKQTSSDYGISPKEVQVGGGTRFSLEFSNQLFMFFDIFLWPVWVLFEDPSPTPCTSCQSANIAYEH